MQSMIFAAGMGTRLKPLTDVIPKALVPVGNKPLLQLVLEKMADADCSRVVVNVHHKAGQIKNFLGLCKYLHFSIGISDESDELLETGGGIRKARSLFNHNEPVLIHNVDILSNVDVKSLYENIDNSDALLLVSERKTQRYLLFDDDMHLVGWTNISTGEVKSPYDNLDVKKCQMFAFSGIHVIGWGLLDDMETWPDKFPIIDFYLNRCKERCIKGYVKKDLKLIDVGKLGTLKDAQDFYQLCS